MWGEKPKKRETIFDEQHYTFLGKGVDFKGTAQFEGTVRVDGHFEGEMHTNDTLIIGEHAVIKGTISGNVVVSGGKVQGNIIARQRIQLFKPAVLIGDVQTPNFSMEEGVCFQGLCDMGVSSLEQLDHPVGGPTGDAEAVSLENGSTNGTSGTSPEVVDWNKEKVVPV